MEKFISIKPLNREIEARIQRNPLLNIDTFIIPSPYILDSELRKDYDFSFVWQEEGEIMGYILVYTHVNTKKFHIYKVVTSPFGRGRGVGTFLIEYLVQKVPPLSQLYLYIWQKQPDTVEFFEKKGFTQGEPLVYRNLVYTHLSAHKEDIRLDPRREREERIQNHEEIGKTRHDARKTLRLLTNMVDMLSVDNGNRIIEDINRETTSLINTLNSYRNSMTHVHKVNLKNLITERIIPYVEASSYVCQFHLVLKVSKPVVLGSHVYIGRALINLTANALEAIEESGREGILRMVLDKKDDKIIFSLTDNGVGISPDRLIRNDEGLPAFVGTTTKGNQSGEGLGTVQVFSTFGAENIKIISGEGKGTTWTIAMDEFSQEQDRAFIRMERRFNEFNLLLDDLEFDENTERQTVITYIWQMRKIEIFLFDVIAQFSNYHNIRDIYRSFLSYRMGVMDRSDWIRISEDWKTDYSPLTQWVIMLADEVKRRRSYLSEKVNVDEFRGSLLKSWGQALNNVMIFTLNPETNHYLATDRKLAEHLDFAPYLNGEKESLLRGEFVGDINHLDQPLFLGVWQVKDEKDLMDKLKLIRKGAASLVEIGINPNKKLAFYQTTYVLHSRDINTDLSSTLGEFSHISDEKLEDYARETEDDLQGFIMMQD
jgi:GNAT superfamily N-acetyltransferase